MTPKNVIIKKGDDVRMECSTDQTSGGRPGVRWSLDALPVVTRQCNVLAAYNTRFTTEAVDANTCAITGLGSSAIGNQGPYHCTDDSGMVAEAVAIVIGILLLLQFLNLSLYFPVFSTYFLRNSEFVANFRSLLPSSILYGCQS